MNTRRPALSIIALAIFSTSNIHAAQTKPPEPNTPVKTESIESKEVLRTKPSDYPIISPTESVFTGPLALQHGLIRLKLVNVSLHSPPTIVFFETMFPEPDSLLNECALGPLIDMNKLLGFDPLGGILNAIKGAMCGFIKNEIHDPFIKQINKPMSKANQWVNSTNQSYSDFLDQETRNLQRSLYDPTTRYDKSGLQFPAGLPAPGNVYPGDRPTTTPQETEEERAARIRQEILNAGGGVSETIIDADGKEVEKFYVEPQQNNDWSDIYNIYK